MENSMRLDILLANINRKAMKKFNKFKLKTAVVNGVSMPYLEEKHSNFLAENRKRIIEEELSLHKKEIDVLKNTGAKEKVLPKPTPEPEPKPTIKEVLDTYRVSKEKKSEFGFNRKEVDIIYNEYFHNQRGYRYIAEILKKDEIKVRKQIAQLMSDFVA